MTQFTETSIRRLARDAAWLHGLAQGLVGDPFEAEDAAQEALATALERQRGGRTTGPRRWLAGVLRNVVRQGWRGRSLRDEHEARWTEKPHAEAAADAAQGIELRRRVVEAVAELEEPYRTAIALRFFEELSPAEVAARTGVPRKTVYTRIDRGLERLRARLDRDYGSRSAWGAALLPFARRTSPSAAGPLGPIPLTLGALTMGTAVKWTLVATTAGLVLWMLRPGAPSARPAEPQVAAAHDPAPEDLVAANDVAGLAEPGGPRREAQPAAASELAPEATPAAPAEPAVATFAGRTVDLGRRPLAGIEVRFEPQDPMRLGQPEPAEDSKPSGGTWSATSGADGLFELPIPEDSGCLKASGKGLAQINAPALFGRAPAERPEILMAPAVELAGRVVDPDGRPIAGATVSGNLPRELAVELLGGAMGNLAPLASTDSDADGRFALEPFGRVEGAYVQALATGYRATQRTLSSDDGAELTLTLEPLDGTEATFAGLVLDARGRSVPGAWVASSGASTQSDAAGRFVLDVEGEVSGTLRAVATGHGPASLEVASIPASARQAVELVLGEPPSTIAGRVVDGAGRPLEGVEVWTVAGEPFGRVARRMGDVRLLMKSSVEELMSPGGRRDWTDADGRFELTGLLPRDYELLALDSATLRLVHGPAVRAPRDGVTLRMTSAEPLGAVAGRVVNFAGEPLNNVPVALEREVPTTTGEGIIEGEPEVRARTDADGRFALDPIVVDGTTLVLVTAGAAVRPRFALEDFSDPEHLELRIPELCHLRVTLNDPDYASELSVLDQDGEAMMFTFNVGEIRLSAASAGLDQGRSDLLEINESATTLVLYRNGEEVDRMPLNPRGGEVEDIRL